MSTTSPEKLASKFRPGQVYRRDTLLPFSKAVDRDLATLAHQGILQKIAAGLYYKPITSRFGVLPPSDKEVVASFLRDDAFLLYSWNQYNSLGLGLTQLYNRLVVYNRKRHGLFKLGAKEFDFRRPTCGFPKAITPEFLWVDLVNNLDELAEDTETIKTKIRENIHRLDNKKLTYALKRFGKIGTKRFFEGLLH